ncbi:MAG: chemotaxis protein CheW [Proteobacteria bacterium]|nr:chemotaxis protein CheW [Pseudomonadota bacterium]
MDLIKENMMKAEHIAHEGNEDPGIEPLDPIAALEQEFVLPSASSVADAPGDHRQEAQVLLRQGFQVGEIRLLVPRDATREVLQSPKWSRIPNTPPWLKGLANIRGGLVPVVDLAEAIGVERDVNAQPYLLVFGSGDDALGLLVDGLPRGRTMRSEERLGTVPPIPDMLRDCVIAAYDQNDVLWFELDAEQFFDELDKKRLAFDS